MNPDERLQVGSAALHLAVRARLRTVRCVAAQTAAYYGGADLVLQAASLANGIALNHAFLDGDKRSAWAACVAFLSLNGHPLPDAALEPLAEQLIAQHELTDRSRSDVMLADWLRARLE